MAEKTGLKSFADGRRDIHMIPPAKITVEAGLNSRDFSMQENLDYVAELAASIRKHGVKEPLTVRAKDGAVLLVNGECRYRAVMALISEGVAIEAIPCQSEGPGVNDGKRLVEQYIRNTGKRFTPLELARHCQRLISFGWDQSTIAGELVITPSYVSQLLSMLEMPEEVQRAVRAGDISASAAATIIREEGEVNGVAAITEAVEEQREEIAREEAEEAAQTLIPENEAAYHAAANGGAAGDVTDDHVEAPHPAPPKKSKKEKKKRGVSVGKVRQKAAVAKGKPLGPKFSLMQVQMVSDFLMSVERSRSLEAVQEKANELFRKLFGKD